MDSNVNISDDLSFDQEKIPAYRDTFVHYLFGTPGHEEMLRDFLNAILENDEQTLLYSVEMRNPFNPARFVMNKYTILDIKATDENGKIFIVEFQTTDRPSFRARMLYYMSQGMVGQLKSGSAYSEIHAVYGVAILTFVMFPHLKGVHNSFLLTAKRDPQIVFSDLFQLHTLEITSEKEEEFPNLKPRLQRWANFFYHAHKKSEEEMQKLLENDSLLQRVLKEYQRFNNDQQMRALDEERERFLHDYATDMEESMRQGHIEGKVEAVLTALKVHLGVEISQKVVDLLEKQADSAVLDALLVHAMTCQSLKEFESQIK